MFLVAVFVVLLSVLYLLFSQQDAAVDDQVCAASMRMLRDFPLLWHGDAETSRQHRVPACQPASPSPLAFFAL